MAPVKATSHIVTGVGKRKQKPRKEQIPGGMGLRPPPTIRKFSWQVEEEKANAKD